MSTSFIIPKDYIVPAGVKEGVDYSDIAVFKIDGDKIHVLAIGEDKTPLASRENKPEKIKGAKEAVKERLAAMEEEDMAAEMEGEAMGEEEAYAEGEEE